MKDSSNQMNSFSPSEQLIPVFNTTSYRHLYKYVDVLPEENGDIISTTLEEAHKMALTSNQSAIQIGCFSRKNPEYHGQEKIYGDFYLCFKNQDEARKVYQRATRKIHQKDIKIEIFSDGSKIWLKIAADMFGVKPDRLLNVTYSLMAECLMDELGLNSIDLNIYQRRQMNIPLLVQGIMTTSILRLTSKQLLTDNIETLYNLKLFETSDNRFPISINERETFLEQIFRHANGLLGILEGHGYDPYNLSEVKSPYRLAVGLACGMDQD